MLTICARFKQKSTSKVLFPKSSAENKFEERRKRKELEEVCGLSVWEMAKKCEEKRSLML